MNATSFTENSYEQAIIALFKDMGYTYESGYDIERDNRNPLYETVLEKSLRRINPELTSYGIGEMMKALKEADLGMSVVVSGLFDMIGECCHKSGLEPHTVEYSLGIWGNTSLLPAEPIMEINTMCGHGMVSVGRIEDIINKINAGRMTCEQGGKELGKTCTCGIFNWKRAGEILQRITGKD